MIAQVAGAPVEELLQPGDRCGLCTDAARRLGSAAPPTPAMPGNDRQHDAANRAQLPRARLAFTWIWDGDTTRQLIELDFEESDGTTTVRFTHSGLWDDEAVHSHEDGWRECFDNLERTLAAARSAS